MGSLCPAWLILEDLPLEGSSQVDPGFARVETTCGTRSGTVLDDKELFKQFVKQRIEKTVFNHLETTKQKHSKVEQIHYKKLEPQRYVLIEDFKDEQIC